jgi:hypothetical protein
MRILITTLACGLALILPSAATFAETVYVPIGQQGVNKELIEKPEQGMTKTQVEQRFGQPRDWRDAVGEPPISSWIYDEFTVYFEYEYVIHSVLKHQPIN